FIHIARRLRRANATTPGARCVQVPNPVPVRAARSLRRARCNTLQAQIVVNTVAAPRRGIGNGEMIMLRFMMTSMLVGSLAVVGCEDTYNDDTVPAEDTTIN